MTCALYNRPVPTSLSPPETFTDAERRALEPYFTNADRHVFALTNLPETVKGALFARYSRSAKSLRRLFLDEFAQDVGGRSSAPAAVGIGRAERLYSKVFNEYRRRFGRPAWRRASGVRVRLERADQGAGVGPPDGVPGAVDTLRALHRQAPRPLAIPCAGGAARAPLRERYVDDDGSDVRDVRAAHRPVAALFRAAVPASDQDSEGVHRAATRAKALDTLRGHVARLNAVERRDLRHRPGIRSAAAADARASARRGARVRRDMLMELRKVIPGVSGPRRSGRSRRAVERVPGRQTRTHRGRCLAAARRLSRRSNAKKSTLTDFDHEGKQKSLPRRSMRRRCCPTISSGARASAVGRRSRGRASRLPRRAQQSASQARSRVRANQLPVRRAHRLRRVPRPAAAPPADDRVAAALDEARLHRAGGDPRRRRAGRLDAGDGRLGGTARGARLRPDCPTSPNTPSRWRTGLGSTWR